MILDVKIVRIGQNHENSTPSSAIYLLISTPTESNLIALPFRRITNSHSARNSKCMDKKYATKYKHERISDMCDTQRVRITKTNVVWRRSYFGIGYIIGFRYASYVSWLWQRQLP